MTVYKVSWELIDGIDGKTRGNDYYWSESEDELDKEFFEDMLSEITSEDIKNLPNFYKEHLQSTNPQDWKIRSVKIDKIRKGDIVRMRSGFPSSKLCRVQSVRKEHARVSIIGSLFWIEQNMGAWVRNMIFIRRPEK